MPNKQESSRDVRRLFVAILLEVEKKYYVYPPTNPLLWESGLTYLLSRSNPPTLGLPGEVGLK
jgi:hypothetical protein